MHHSVCKGNELVSFVHKIFGYFFLISKFNSSLDELKFYEEPANTYLTKTTPAILKCKIENARTGFFKCNDQWSQDPINSKIVQVNQLDILKKSSTFINFEILFEI